MHQSWRHGFWASRRTQYLQRALWNCTSGHIMWTLLQSFTPCKLCYKTSPPANFTKPQSSILNRGVIQWHYEHVLVCLHTAKGVQRKKVSPLCCLTSWMPSLSSPMRWGWNNSSGARNLARPTYPKTDVPVDAHLKFIVFPSRKSLSQHPPFSQLHTKPLALVYLVQRSSKQ